MTSPRQLLAERYRELLEEIYQSCADATPELPLELQLQEWWAAGLLPHQGTTQDGKTLNILDKGRWNRCPTAPATASTGGRSVTGRRTPTSTATLA